MDNTSSTVIQNLARKLGIRPSNILGQNFLVDQDILNEIVLIADIKKGEHILEIGPGFGVLTSELTKKGANVLAVEQDKKLADNLSKTGKAGKLTVIQKDILKYTNKEISKYFSGEPYRIVANIPYNITGKIIKKFVSAELPKPTSALLLVQKEVGERICSEPGSMNLLALSVQAYAEPRIAMEVPRIAFWPEPKVDSALLEISDINEKPKHGIQDEKRFWQLIHIGFASPRKQLQNNISNGLKIESSDSKKAIHSLGLSETIRAQELGISDWIGLISALGEN
jgi:16S rRNA (adenine1518-N6/adenine1519-N6)-dimethyltransferase